MILSMEVMLLFVVKFQIMEMKDTHTHYYLVWKHSLDTSAGSRGGIYHIQHRTPEDKCNVKVMLLTNTIAVMRK